MLRQQQIPADWVAAVLDRNGVIVARSRNAARYVGLKAPPEFLAHLAIKEQEEGFFESPSLEGAAMLSVFSRAPRFGWSVYIGVPKTEITGPAFAAAMRTFAIDGLLLLLGVALAMIVARRITGPINLLHRLAGTADRSQLLDRQPTGLREADAVAQALRDAELDRRRSEEQERAARAAQQISEQSFRYLFDNSPLPQWLLDPATLKFLAVNDAAITVYGYSRDEFLTMGLDDIRPPEDRARLARTMEIASLHRHTVDWRHRYKSGRLVDVEIFSHALTFDGKPARVAVILDVTARKAPRRSSSRRRRWRPWASSPAASRMTSTICWA
ncbi:MAG: PAS domain S-box protein [Pseudomonadota bacterium]